MRLISQNGELDIPYDRVAIDVNKREKNKIIAYGVESLNNNSYWNLGEYSTEEKAREVIGMIRNAYYAERKCFQFPEDKEV